MNLVSAAMYSVACWSQHAILFAAVNWIMMPPPAAPDPQYLGLGMILAIMWICIGHSIHHTTTSSDATTASASNTARNQMIEKKDAPIQKKIHKNQLLSHSNSCSVLGLFWAFSPPSNNFLRRLLLVFRFRGNLRVFSMLSLLLPLVKGDDNLHPGLTFRWVRVYTVAALPLLSKMTSKKIVSEIFKLISSSRQLAYRIVLFSTQARFLQGYQPVQPTQASDGCHTTRPP